MTSRRRPWSAPRTAAIACEGGVPGNDRSRRRHRPPSTAGPHRPWQRCPPLDQWRPHLHAGRVPLHGTVLPRVSQPWSWRTTPPAMRSLAPFIDRWTPAELAAADVRRGLHGDHDCHRRQRQPSSWWPASAASRSAPGLLAAVSSDRGQTWRELPVQPTSELFALHVDGSIFLAGSAGRPPALDRRRRHLELGQWSGRAPGPLRTVRMDNLAIDDTTHSVHPEGDLYAVIGNDVWRSTDAAVPGRRSRSRRCLTPARCSPAVPSCAAATALPTTARPGPRCSSSAASAPSASRVAVPWSGPSQRTPTWRSEDDRPVLDPRHNAG